MAIERKQTRDAEGSILKRIEERRTIGGKTRKETAYYARVRMNEYDAFGRFVRAHERKRKAGSFADAVILRRKLRSELQAELEQKKDAGLASRIYFFDLLDFYESRYVKAAVYSDGKKIAGMRSSPATALQQLKTFRDLKTSDSKTGNHSPLSCPASPRSIRRRSTAFH